MKKSNRINFAVTGALFSLFVMLTTMLMYVDVKPVGPKGSYVGLATLNKWMSERLGVNMLLYHITDWLGVVPVLFALGFAILGLTQLINRKSLKRVDYSILVLGAFYLLVIGAYLFFEFNIRKLQTGSYSERFRSVVSFFHHTACPMRYVHGDHAVQPSDKGQIGKNCH